MTPHSKRRGGGRLAVLIGVSTALLVLPGMASAQPGTQAPSPTVVATGLDNPRGLALDGHGRLYVGEAGHAGPFCVGAGEMGPECVGLTSQIGWINLASGRHRTLVGGLPSLGTAVGSTGVDGIALVGRGVAGIMTAAPQEIPEDPCDHLISPSATATATVTVAPELKAACPRVLSVTSHLLGDLIVVGPRRAVSLAEVGSYDYTWIVRNKASLGATANPDFTPGDANPYGIATTTGGFYVVDAGSNTLDFVDRYGNVRVLRDDAGKPLYFPDPPGPADQRFPYDAVPTCVISAGSSVYVGSLSGNLWRIDAASHHVTVVADRSKGLTSVNGCALDNDGNVIVSNIFGTGQATFTPNSGSIVKVTPAGAVTTLATGVNFPAGIAVDRQNRAYVAVNSVCPKSLSLIGKADPPLCKATGAVWRMQL